MTPIIDPDLLLKFIDAMKLGDAEVGGLFRLFSRCWRDGWVSKVDIEHAIDLVDANALYFSLADEWEERFRSFFKPHPTKSGVCVINEELVNFWTNPEDNCYDKHSISVTP